MLQENFLLCGRRVSTLVPLRHLVHLLGPETSHETHRLPNNDNCCWFVIPRQTTAIAKVHYTTLTPFSPPPLLHPLSVSVGGGI
jgi:hypothetical protein